ncbi:MAG TPA: hypothetical protein VGN26_23485, partial [Armatimonadota bacterium]
MLGVGLTLALTLLLSTHFLPDRVKLDLGDVSPEEISAQRTVEYVDSLETQRKRAEAADRTSNRYDEVTFAASDALGALSTLFSQAQAARQEYPYNPLQASRQLQRASGPHLTRGTALTLVQNTPAEAERLQRAAKDLLTQVMDQGIRDQPDDRPRVYREIPQLIPPDRFAPPQRAALEEAVRVCIRPNRQLNLTRSQEAREEEMANVVPVRGQIHKGETILRKGDRINQTHLDKLTALGLRSPDVDLGRMLSIGALIALLVGFVTFYLREHQPTVHSDFRRMSLLALVVCLTVLGMKIGTTTLGIRLDSVIIGYLGLLWIPAAAMMLSVLLSAHTGGLVATLLAIGTGLSLDLELRYVAATIASSLVGVYVVAHIRDRNGL